MLVDIRDLMKNQPIRVHSEPQSTDRVGIPTSQANSGPIKISESPKLQFAIAYLQQNLQAKGMSGRQLEATVRMAGETISYKWWNKAKKLVK